MGVSRSSSSMLSRLLLSVVCDVWEVWCSGCGAPSRSTPCWAAAAAGIPASGSPPGRMVSSLVSSGSYREEPIIGGQGCTLQGAWLCNSRTGLCNHNITSHYIIKGLSNHQHDNASAWYRCTIIRQDCTITSHAVDPSTGNLYSHTDLYLCKLAIENYIHTVTMEGPT